MSVKISSTKYITFRTQNLVRNGNFILLHHLELNQWNRHYPYTVITYTQKEYKALAHQLDLERKKHKGVVRITLSGYQSGLRAILGYCKQFKQVKSFVNPNSGSHIRVYQSI